MRRVRGVCHWVRELDAGSAAQGRSVASTKGDIGWSTEDTIYCTDTVLQTCALCSLCQISGGLRHGPPNDICIRFPKLLLQSACLRYPLLKCVLIVPSQTLLVHVRHLVSRIQLLERRHWYSTSTWH